MASGSTQLVMGPGRGALERARRWRRKVSSNSHLPLGVNSVSGVGKLQGTQHDREGGPEEQHGAGQPARGSLCP